MRHLLYLLAFVAVLSTLPCAAQSDACSNLAHLKLEHAAVTAAVSVTTVQAPADLGLNAAQLAALPAFCRVQIVDRPGADSEIHTEVWLPIAGWSGRLRGIGNGGFAGNIYFDQMANALQQGYVTAGTDAGHTGMTGDFALGHSDKVKDFGWRAIHDMTVEAKVVIQALYGKAAAHAYFTACSDGGREAFMEAQRFPADYDGILAGAPAYNWTALVSAGTLDNQVLLASPASYVPASKLPALANAVRNACDAQDGVKDSILNDPRTCHFDPAALLCKAEKSDACLTAEQVKSVKTLYSNKLDAAGHDVFPGYAMGAEDAEGGMNGWIVGKVPGAPTALLFFGTGFFSNFVYQKADWTLASFNFARDLDAANSKTALDLNATDTNLKPFAQRGGKLIVYHGWNDPAIPAMSSIRYFDGLASTMGAHVAEAFAKLYMIPGMLHCDGGPGATNFEQGSGAVRKDAEHDVVTALELWVEQGKAPAAIVATGPVGSRPICAYPAVAKYLGGDTHDARSFTCAVPAK